METRFDRKVSFENADFLLNSRRLSWPQSATSGKLFVLSRIPLFPFPNSCKLMKNLNRAEIRIFLHKSYFSIKFCIVFIHYCVHTNIMITGANSVGSVSVYRTQVLSSGIGKDCARHHFGRDLLQHKPITVLSTQSPFYLYLQKYYRLCKSSVVNFLQAYILFYSNVRIGLFPFCVPLLLPF